MHVKDSAATEEKASLYVNYRCSRNRYRRILLYFEGYITKDVCLPQTYTLSDNPKAKPKLF